MWDHPHSPLWTRISVNLLGFCGSNTLPFDLALAYTHTHTHILTSGHLWGLWFTIPLVRTTSSPTVIRKILSRFSCLLPHLLIHLFKVWKMLILLVGTALWGRAKNSTLATYGDLSTDGTYGNMPTPGYLWGPLL